MSHRNYGVEDVGRGGRRPRRDGVDVCRLVCESVRFQHGFMIRWAASERLSARHLRQLIPSSHPPRPDWGRGSQSQSKGKKTVRCCTGLDGAKRDWRLYVCSVSRAGTDEVRVGSNTVEDGFRANHHHHADGRRRFDGSGRYATRDTQSDETEKAEGERGGAGDEFGRGRDFLQADP